MTMMSNKEVRTVTVIYADGEMETFDPIVGFHRVRREYERGLPKEGEPRDHHEIRWSSPVPEPDPE